MDTINHFVNGAGVSSEAAALFEALIPAKLYEKNTVIYTQGEDAEAFYYMKRGCVRIFMASEDGMEKTLATIGRGTVLGEAAFFDGKPRISSAITVSKSEIISIRRNDLTAAISARPEIAMELFRIQAQTIRMLSAQVDSMTFLQAGSRVAQFLLQSAVRRNGAYCVQATLEEIASFIGVSRVTVSKILNRLADKGVVRTGYKKIMILSPERLEQETKS